jgi:hypothetical protein
VSAPERQTRRKCVDIADFEGPLAGARDEIARLIGEHGEDAYIQIDVEDNTADLRVFVNRPETDAEYEYRMAEIKRAEDREREQYARLKAKYDGGAS